MAGQPIRVLLALLVVAALLVPLSPPSHLVTAQGADETPAMEWVEAQYNVTFQDFSTIRVDARSAVYEADLGLTYGVPASWFRGEMDSDPTLKQEYIDQAEQDLRDVINGTLDSLDLKNATLEMGTGYIADIGQNVTGDPYKEPVMFGASGKVTLTPACLGLSSTGSVDHLIRGTLNMGGVLNLSVELKARPGHLNVLHIVPPSGFYFRAGLALMATQDLSIDARNSTVPLNRTTYVVLVSGSPAVLTERIDAAAFVDLRTIEDASFSVNVSIYAVDATDISSHFPTILGIYEVSADGLRLAVAAGLVTWDEIRSMAVQAQLDKLEQGLGGMLTGPLDLTFQWSQDSLDGYDEDVMKGPPVMATMAGSGKVDLKGMSRHVAEDALWSGAKVPFELGISNTLNWSVEMLLPKNITLEGTGLAPKASIDDRDLYGWNKAFNPFKGDMIRKDVWDPGRNGTADIKIEVLGVDYDLGRILFLKETTVTLKMTVTLAIESVPVDEYFMDRVPDDVKLERMNADLIRALLADGKVTRSEIDEILQEAAQEMDARIEVAIHKEVDFRLFLDEPTLGVNATGPILLKGSLKTSVKKSMSSEDAIGNTMEVAKSFTLFGKDGWRMQYTIVLPKGLEIVRVKRSLKSSDFKEPPQISNDRRTLVEVLDGDLEDNVTLYVAPTDEKAIAITLMHPLCFGSIIALVVTIIVCIYLWRVWRRKAHEKDGARRPRHHPPAHPHHVHKASQGTRGLDEDRDGEALDGYKRLKPHMHKHRLPLKTWKSDDWEAEEETAFEHAQTAGAPPPPRPSEMSRSEVPLARPKPYKPAPSPTKGPKHITTGAEKFVKCPACGRRFGVLPEQQTIECPHCGKKGKTGQARQHITTATPSAAARPRSKSVKCPRCGDVILYNEGAETIRCTKCGKEGRVKKKA